MLAPFREGEVSPSLQTQGFPLPPQRDGSVFFPPPSLHSAGARFPCPQRPLDMSFCGFPQGGKWERSRPSKNSKSKRQLATCPQRPIYGVFVFFRKAENVSLREQTKTRRASGSLRHGPWRCHIKKSRISKFVLTETEFGDIIFTCRHNRKAAQLFDSEGTEGRQKRRWARQENRISFWPTGQEYT